MFGLGTFVFLLLVVFLHWRVSKRAESLEKTVARLSGDVQRLQEHLQALEPGDIGTAEEFLAESASKVPEPARASVAPVGWKAPSAASPAPIAPAASKAKTPKPPNKLFAAARDNWAGIMGVSILVLGLTFLAVLVSQHISPAMRCFGLVLVAFALWGGSRHLARHARWGLLANWLQAGAGALILFAGLGAGGIPGLQFLSNPLYALLALNGAILANLICAYRASAEALAGYHVFLSLLVLFFVPQNEIIFASGTAVAALGALLSFRRRWDLNLIVTLLAFAAFHFHSLPPPSVISQDQRLMGIGAVLGIGAIAAAVHYRKHLERPAFAWLPFVAHVLNWTLMGVQLGRHSTGSPWVSTVLAAAAVGLFFLSRWARRQGIRWVSLTDLVLAQLLMLLAIAMLSRLNLARQDIAFLAFCETLLFCAVLRLEKEWRVLRASVPVALSIFAGILLLPVLSDSDGRGGFQEAGCVGAALLALGAVRVFMFRSGGQDFSELKFLRTCRLPSDERQRFSLCDVGIALGVLWLSWRGLHQAPWATLLLAATWLGALCLRRVRQELGFSWVLGLVAVSLFAESLWILLDAGRPLIDRFLWGALPPMLVSGGVLVWGGSHSARLLSGGMAKVSVYAFFGVTTIAVFVMGKTSSDLIPLPAYALLSILCLEISEQAQYLRSGWSGAFVHLQAWRRQFLWVGHAFIALFLICFAGYAMPTSTFLLGSVPLRPAFEFLGLATLAHWLAHRSSDAMLPSRAHSWLWEVALLFGVTVIAVETPVPWHPVAFAVLALLLSVRTHWLPERRSLWAELMVLAACLHLAVVSSTWASPARSWFSTTHFTGPLAMSVLALTSVVLWKRFSEPFDVSASPRALEPVARRMRSWLGANRLWAGIYPWMGSAALFLFWRFEKAWLTLLWVTLLFVLFALGFLLKQRQLIRVGSVALLICAARLVFFDLNGTALEIRAVVFILCGLLMVGIYYLQTRFKNRISSS